MIRSLKYRLAHIDATSIRYRMAHQVVKEEQLRKSHACTLYWVYLPVAVIGFVLARPVRLALWLVSQPIAWLAGYRKVGPLLPIVDADAQEDIAKQAVYRNAHVRLAPWRIVLPLLMLTSLLILGMNPVLRFVEVVTLAAIAFAVFVGWLLFQHRGRVSNAWDRVCPRLSVSEFLVPNKEESP